MPPCLPPSLFNLPMPRQPSEGDNHTDQAVSLLWLLSRVLNGRWLIDHNHHQWIMPVKVCLSLTPFYYHTASSLSLKVCYNEIWRYFTHPVIIHERRAKTWRGFRASESSRLPGRKSFNEKVERRDYKEGWPSQLVLTWLGKMWEKRVGNRRVNEKEFSTTSILQLIMFQCIHYPSNTRAKGVRVKLSLVSTASGATFQLQDSAIHWAAKEKQLRKKEVQKHRTPIEG